MKYPVKLKSFETWKWTSYDGLRSVEISDFIKQNSENHFFIGTDSQNYFGVKEVCVFTSVLIAYRLGRGGSVITAIDRCSTIQSLRQRLVLEAMRSLDVAWYLAKRIPNEQIIGIHLDVNNNLKFKSGQYKDELVGLIMAQGFRALVKPDSWAATNVADSKC